MTTDPTSAPLFANAMWRSGSTYLASRFAASPRYLLFYEPFHEGVGRRPSAKRTRDRSRDRDLRHPDIEGGYFGSFERLHPVTGIPLTQYFPPECSLRNVFNDASDTTVAYLRALSETAAAEGKTAFLGFCRSGTQTTRACALIEGQSLHLWRDPRDQFGSYGWPSNDYFMAGTALQLLFSAELADIATGLAPRALRSPWLALAKRLPDGQARLQYRLARRATASLAAEEAYALFYLSWVVSFDYGQAGSDLSFSLAQLTEDASLRHRVMDQFGISFDDLSTPPSRQRDGIGYGSIEARVSAMLGTVSVRPAKSVA